MKLKYFALVFLIIVSGIVVARMIPPAEPAIGNMPQPVTKFQEMVQVFLTAVDRGELIVFGKVLDRTMISPVEVRYIYTKNNPEPSIEVYSLLLTTVELPGLDNCNIEGIGASLDVNGTIIESRVHVSPK
ncbi:MAG: hypothetical protein LJE74_01015 [Proteobacteria bacterium]|jgi:hypothetical protein|nr:hypothetical protein [Pseudomonadota bacterium]